MRLGQQTQSAKTIDSLYQLTTVRCITQQTIAHVLFLPVADIRRLLPAVDFCVTMSHCIRNSATDQYKTGTEHQVVHGRSIATPVRHCPLQRPARSPDAENPRCCCLHKFEAVRRGAKGVRRFKALMVTRRVTREAVSCPCIELTDDSGPGCKIRQHLRSREAVDRARTRF